MKYEQMLYVNRHEAEAIENAIKSASIGEVEACYAVHYPKTDERPYDVTMRITAVKAPDQNVEITALVYSTDRDERYTPFMGEKTFTTGSIYNRMITVDATEHNEGDRYEAILAIKD